MANGNANMYKLLTTSTSNIQQYTSNNNVIRLQQEIAIKVGRNKKSNDSLRCIKVRREISFQIKDYTIYSFKFLFCITSLQVQRNALFIIAKVHVRYRQAISLYPMKFTNCLQQMTNKYKEYLIKDKTI